MDAVERYNLILKGEEDATIRILNRVLDKSFNRILRRIRVWLRTKDAPSTERDIALLKTLRELVTAANPNKTDIYDQTFYDAMRLATQHGVDVADSLVGQMAGNKPRIDVSVPIDATLSAARQAHGYLRKHGERFAETSAEIIAAGVAEGRSTDKVVREVRDRLGVVKTRAEIITRTELLRAYNDASNRYYSANGIDLVLYYATADDRSCPTCAPRGGQIYKRTEITVPIHPRCRCFLSPWDPDLASIDAGYKAAAERHRKEMKKAVTIEPADLNRAAVFEQLAPTPVAVD